jgi:iron complex outermembrane receptor protein
LRLNAALYAYTWDDLQVSQIEIVNGTPSTRIVNAGKAERWGGEIEMLLAPVDDLVLGVSYSHLDGDYEEFPDLCGTNVPQECLTGEDFAKRGASPDNQLNVFADYLIARTEFGELTTFVNLNWQDDWYETAAWTAVVDGNPVVYPHQVMDARTVIDARLSLENIELGGGNLRVSLWGKNLMDETYPNYSINFGSSVGLIVENYGDPRTWGVELAYEY